MGLKRTIVTGAYPVLEGNEYLETNPILRSIMLQAKDKPDTVFVVQNYAVVAKPITDFSKKNIGYLVLGYDLTPILDSYKELGVYILMFVFVGLVVSFLVSYLIEHTERISMGDVDQKIPISQRMR